ncbi:MAG: hypothetical protein II476_01715 [Bacteroidales bacterium]|nr:hypothetical protein [Bacteroidales bacterium]
MKKDLIIVVAFLCLVACNTREYIRKQVMEHGPVEICPLLNMIEWYSYSYYCLPEDMDEIFSFFDREWSIDSSGLVSTKPYIDYARSHRHSYAFYSDSVFIYDPYHKYGFRVEGHPLYWLEHPERFPENMPDYWGNFRPAAYYKDGLISRSFDYEKYKIWTRKKIDAICRYDRKTDELKVLAGVDKPYDISPEDTALVQRLTAVKDTVRMFMKENPDIYSYVFPMQLSEKGNPWRFRLFEDWASRHTEESVESYHSRP